MKRSKKLLSVFLTLVFTLSFASQALAAVSLPSISSNKPLITYTINSS